MTGTNSPHSHGTHTFLGRWTLAFTTVLLAQAQNSAAINADKAPNFSRLDKDLIDTRPTPASISPVRCGNFSKLYSHSE